MDIDVLEAYMKDMAIHHTAIAHTELSKSFLRDSITNLLTSTRNGLQVKEKYVMVMENPEGRLTDNLSDSPKDYQAFAFWIAKHVPKDDALAEKEIRTVAKKIGLQIIAKMKKDCVAIPRPTALKWMDLGSVSYNPIGPLLDSCYGYRFELTIHDQVNLTHDPANWTY